MNTATRSMIDYDANDENSLTLPKKIEDTKRELASFERQLVDAQACLKKPDAGEGAQQRVDDLRELIVVYEIGLSELEHGLAA